MTRFRTGLVKTTALALHAAARDTLSGGVTAARYSQNSSPKRVAQLQHSVWAGHTLLIIALIVFWMPPAYAQIYRCIENGVTVFTDQPCEGAETVEVGPVNAAAQVAGGEYANAGGRGYSSSVWYTGATGYEQARQKAKAYEAPMILYFRTEWCGYCRDVERNLFPASAALAAMKHFVKVRVNPEDGDAEYALFKRYGGRGYPTFLVEPWQKMPQKMAVTRAPSAGNTKRNIEPRKLVERLQRFLPEPPEPTLTDANAYAERALRHANAGTYDKALRDMHRAIALQPRRAHYYQLACEMMAATQQNQECIVLWSRYIELMPDDVAGYTGRAQAYELAGNADQQQRDLARVQALETVSSEVPSASSDGLVPPTQNVAP